VLHCFTGTEAFAKACVDLGFYVSFSGILTFKNAESIRATLAALPKDRLLVETDAPYLAPIPHRGKKGEPRMVVDTAKFAATLLKIPFEAFALLTATNARQLFFPG
jgi:TatD DNase family protein